jgi:hypothetical protein
MRLCWADKIALTALGLVFSALFLLSGIGNPNFGSPDWAQAFGNIMILLGLKFIAPLWVVLRILDLLTNKTRRRS